MGGRPQRNVESGRGGGWQGAGEQGSERTRMCVSEPAEPATPPGAAPCPTTSVAVVALEDDRPVMSPKPDVVRQCVPDRQCLRLADDPDVALGIEVTVVERRRSALLRH